MKTMKLLVDTRHRVTKAGDASAMFFGMMVEVRPVWEKTIAVKSK